MSSVSPTNQDLSNDTTFRQIKTRVPVPLNKNLLCVFLSETICTFVSIGNRQNIETKSTLKVPLLLFGYFLFLLHAYKLTFLRASNVMHI